MIDNPITTPKRLGTIMIGNNIDVPYCPWCNKQMKIDEVYPYEPTSYKCDCDSWKAQEKLLKEMSNLEKELLRVKNELKHLRENSLRSKEIEEQEKKLREIKKHYSTLDGYRHSGREIELKGL